MAKQSDHISDEIKKFIDNQQIFFVGTAAEDGRVNVSPKGMDTFRVLDKNRVMWLNLTGSGNETAAHILTKNRITIMFCAFEGKPLILRLYGQARIYHQQDKEWTEYEGLFPRIAGARQIFDISVDLVQTSCGMAVPFYGFKGERRELESWAEKQGDEKLKAYRKEKNRVSIDGFPTDIVIP